MSSKYVLALKRIGVPASPSQIRKKIEEDPQEQLTSQQVASALHSLKSRNVIRQLENGLYILPPESDDEMI